MARYAISMTYRIPAEKATDGKAHQHKCWYGTPLDFGLGVMPVFGKRKDRLVFNRKSDADAVARALRPRRVVVEKISE